jgi:hypothetical protein
VQQVGNLSRVECRRQFERRFTVDSMVDRYEEVYLRLIAGRYAVSNGNNGNDG